MTDTEGFQLETDCDLVHHSPDKHRCHNIVTSNMLPHNTFSDNSNAQLSRSSGVELATILLTTSAMENSTDK